MSLRCPNCGTESLRQLYKCTTPSCPNYDKVGCAYPDIKCLYFKSSLGIFCRECHNEAKVVSQESQIPSSMKLMKDEEFRKFFDDVASVVVDKEMAKKSVFDILEANGIKMNLPAPVAEKVMPILKLTQEQQLKSNIPHSCAPCGACGFCAACSELNAAAAGAQAASIWHILD